MRTFKACSALSRYWLTWSYTHRLVGVWDGEIFNMADKPKVHVFAGAPNLSLSEEALGKGSCEWRTLELSWNQGRLTPMRELVGAQTISNVNAGVTDGANSTNDQEKPNDLGLHQVSKMASEEDVTPPISQSCLAQSALPEKEDLCTKVVIEYLDGCFPSQVSPRPEPDPERSHVMSTWTEYLTTWTKSQCLLLESGMVDDHNSGSLGTPGSTQTPPKQTLSPSLCSPELYSPEESPGERGLGGTLQGSGNMFESQWLHEGGVFLARTPDGVLFSQSGPVEQEDSEPLFEPPDTPVEHSPAPSTSKRIKLSTDRAWSKRRTDLKGMLAPEGHTVLLSSCRSHGVSYAVLVAVVHPCHLKEIRVKSGASAGTDVPLATVVITDQSRVEMKLVLWRAAAFWALTIHPGDIILITGVTVHVDKWRGETVLQSSYMSRLLNLGQIPPDRTPQAPGNVDVHTLRELCTHLHESRPLLVSLPRRNAQDLNSIPFANLGSLHLDTLTHALLRVKHTRMISVRSDKAEGVSRTGTVPKAVLTVEQRDGMLGAMVLWGVALTWLQRIGTDTDTVWEFRLLLVKQDVTSGLPELHSTPFSSCQRLSTDDPRFEKFCTTVRPHRGTSSFEIDLRTLLSQKYSGDVELRARITSLEFQSSPSQDAVQPMDRGTSLEKIMDIVSGDITFTGCGLCSAELDTDENGIYRPCYPCLPHTGVRRYYRPVVLTVREGPNQIRVQAPPTTVQMLLGISPDKLNKETAPESGERFVQVVAKTIHSVLSTPRLDSPLAIRSYFNCDENGIPVIQKFLLLDFPLT